MTGGDHAQHRRLSEPVHQPALCDRAERVGEPERPHDAHRVRERAGRLAGEPQDRDDEHADRQRSEGRRDHRAAGARNAKQRSVTTHVGEI
jgi:hypothetical protein